ncbi:MAG: ribose-phosphate diphosphokinase [Hyphomonadaceae bacterium]|nr:ribose-phosphate diphosphokinase [Hyphomonadaceae bacterium]
MSSMIFSTPNAHDLASKIATRVGLRHGRADLHTFPDGESLFRILDPVEDQHIHLVARLDRPDDKIMQLLLLADGLRQYGAASVKLVAPYLPYMRQDIAFNPGEVISAKVFAGLISQHFDGLITVDPHLHRFATLDAVYEVPSRALSATKEMARWIAQNTTSPIIIGPDSESEQWVRKIAEALRAPYATLQKVRHGDRDVEVSIDHLDFDNVQSVVLVDDIISSGTTLLRSNEFVKRLNANIELNICAVHCLATLETIDQLRAAGARKIVASNSIESPICGFDIADTISGALNANGLIKA